MLRRLLRVVVPLLLACMLGPGFAHAAIYTWVDASGTVNLSNLAPPEGARVTHIVQDSPPRTTPPPRTDADRDVGRELEVQALSDRVRQLEYEAEFARRQAPPAPVYVPAPTVQYSQFPADYGPATNSGCDPSWAGCGSWWSGYGYGYPAVVVVQPGFRRNRPIHGGPNFPVRRPMGNSSVAYRR